MKKQILLFLALIMSIVTSAQVTIQMEKDGGVHKVPCTVNGVKMKFIFDTGAATVSMSQTMAQFLLDGDYLSATDIKGTGQSVLADGSIVNHAIVNLRDVEIGGMHIHNIEATVIEGQNAPLLLGQSAISELGRVTIDGNRLVIHNAENELTQKQIDQLEEQIERYIKEGSDAAAIDALLKIDAAVGLTERGLWQLSMCYNQNHHWEDCIKVCKRWLSEYEWRGDAFYRESIYSNLGSAYFFGKEDYNIALLYYQKSLDEFKKENLKDDYGEKTMIMLKASDYYMIGSCHYGLGVFHSAITNYKQAIKLQCEYLSVSLERVQNGMVQDERLGLFLCDYANCYYKQNEEVNGDEIMKMAALCGNQDAIDFCRKYNISYQTKSSKMFE